MYVFSKTPDPPEKSLCPQRQNEDHSPAHIVGSNFERMFPTVPTDDGGIVQVMPCKYCGQVYWIAIKAEDVLQ